MEVPDEHRAFADSVAATQLQDPMPTFEALSRATGIPVSALVRYALVRWAASGSEMLMAVEPEVLQRLVTARRREDWEAVARIIDWLTALG